MNALIGTLLTPAQLLAQFAEPVDYAQRRRQDRINFDAAVVERTVVTLIADMIELCKTRIASLDAIDAVLISEGKPARPINFTDRMQRAYTEPLMNPHINRVMDSVHEALQALGWRAEVGRGGFTGRPGCDYRNEILLYSRKA